MESYKKYEDAFFKSLLEGNRAGCENIMSEFRKFNLPIIVLYEEIFKKSLYRIGEMWEYNKISTAVEQMATSITEGLMNELFYEIVSMEGINKKIVIACVENEEHQVGGKMVADIFEKNSWDTHYLGANTSMNELLGFCDLVKPDLVCLSLSIYANVQFLLKEIQGIRAVTNIPILIGGQALIKLGVKISSKYKDVLYFENLEDIENYIKGAV